MDDKKYWLNEHGLRYWKNKNDANLNAMRSYHWVNLVALIDESDGKRKYVGHISFTKFLEVEQHWYPMSKKEYQTLHSDYKEKYNENKK